MLSKILSSKLVLGPVAGMAVAAVLGSATLAQDLKDPAEYVNARHGYMLMMAMNLATLGGMAKGETPYDATAAKMAAATLASLGGMDTAFLWLPGSEAGKAQDSSALAPIFTEVDKRNQMIKSLADATAAMQTAAGTDAASLKGAMAAVGEACAACHKAYRQPE